MSYLTHPNFDRSLRSQWIEIPFDREGRLGKPETERELAEIVLRDFHRITELVLGRFSKHIPVDWLVECPDPLLIDLSFHPTDGGTIRIFLEYVYVPDRDNGSHHSDSWWAIVGCPYPTGNPVTKQVDYFIEHLGWSVD